jgi:hypothetical protein
MHPKGLERLQPVEAALDEALHPGALSTKALIGGDLADEVVRRELLEHVHDRLQPPGIPGRSRKLPVERERFLEGRDWSSPISATAEVSPRAIIRATSRRRSRLKQQLQSAGVQVTG